MKASTKILDGDTDSDEVMSDGDSVESKKTTKSVSRAFDKHCLSGNCGGRLITGNSWFKHNTRKHTGVVISYRVCEGSNCIDCK